MSEACKSRLNIKKMILCIIILSAVMVLQLYLYCTTAQDIFTKLKESENSMKNFTWVVEHVVYLLPVIVIALFMMIAYSGDRHICAVKHKEQAVEAVFVMLFTFLIMLPFVIIKSKTGEIPEPGEVEEVQSLLEMTTMWFAYQFIPFLILIMYHSVKGHAGSEEAEQISVKSV